MIDQEKDEENISGFLKIILMGDKGVGVTSFFNKYCGRIFNQGVLGTFGAEFSYKALDEKKEKTFQIWHITTTTPEKLGFIKQNFIPNSSGGIIMFDVSNRESFLNTKSYIKFMLDAVKTFVSLALVGNKIDLQGQTTDYVTDEEAENYCESLGETFQGAHFKIKYFPLSALADSNVDECFLYILKTYMRYKDSIPKFLVIGERNTNIRDFFRKYIIESEKLSTETMIKTVEYNEKKIGVEFTTIPFLLKDSIKDYLEQRIYYYKQSIGAIFVFEFSNRQSFNQVDVYVKEFLQYNKSENPLLVILGDDVTTREDNLNNVTDEEAENYCLLVKNEEKRPNLKIQYFPISVKTNLNIEQCFQTIAESITMNNKLK